MRPIPTDLEILEEIYRRYYSIFVEFSRETPTRKAKVYVPIDLIGLAEHFRTDTDIIFGRLYYHLEPKYGFVQPDKTRVPFFEKDFGGEKHVVQFPMLAAVLAELQEERTRYEWAMWLSIAALALSVVSIVISVI